MSPGKINHLSPRSSTGGHDQATIKVGPAFQAEVPAFTGPPPPPPPLLASGGGAADGGGDGGIAADRARVGAVTFCPDAISAADVATYLEGAASTRHPTTVLAPAATIAVANAAAAALALALAPL